MKKRMLSLLTMSILAVSLFCSCGKSENSDSQNESKADSVTKEENSVDITETAEKDEIEDLVTEDQIVSATYDSPAHLGEWVEVKCGVDDDEEYEHESDAYGKAYVRITNVLNKDDSKEYYREHIQGWESSWTNDVIGLNKVDMDEDGKLQWNVVEYEIYFPSDFSECPTCYPNLDNTVLFYYAVGDDNIDTVDDDNVKQTWTYGELHSLSSEMHNTRANREYEASWQESHKIDEEYYNFGIRERGTLHKGWIMFWTHMEPEQSLKIDIRSLSSSLNDKASRDYYNPHDLRSVHDESDTGKYIEFQITGE